MKSIKEMRLPWYPSRRLDILHFLGYTFEVHIGSMQLKACLYLMALSGSSKRQKFLAADEWGMPDVD
jgi:hypothetical protein